MRLRIGERPVSSKDRTKTRNGLGNGWKNGSIKLKICRPSVRVNNFHSRGLSADSALVTRTSMQVLPPRLRAQLAEHYRKTNADVRQVGLVLHCAWQSGNGAIGATKYCTVDTNFTIVYIQAKTVHALIFFFFLPVGT